jgi:hypothetical protein
MTTCDWPNNVQLDARLVSRDDHAQMKSWRCLHSVRRGNLPALNVCRPQTAGEGGNADFDPRFPSRDGKRWYHRDHPKDRVADTELTDQTPRKRNRRHRASMPCPSSERLRPFRIGSIVQIPNPMATRWGMKVPPVL